MMSSVTLGDITTIAGAGAIHATTGLEDTTLNVGKRVDNKVNCNRSTAAKALNICSISDEHTKLHKTC